MGGDCQTERHAKLTALEGPVRVLPRDPEQSGTEATASVHHPRRLSLTPMPETGRRQNQLVVLCRRPVPPEPPVHLGREGAGGTTALSQGSKSLAQQIQKGEGARWWRVRV